MGTRGEVFSSKANTAKRTYFFNVKENRTGDIFLNVVESKRIGSDTRAFTLARDLRKLLGHRYAIVSIGPAAYNRLYAAMRNVNRILAWGHARTIENLLEKVPSCPLAISDQFGSKEQVSKALMKKGRKIELVQRHRAESDLAVAAASVLARASFLWSLREFQKRFGLPFPKGASEAVKETAVELLRKNPPPVLLETAKCHFKTTDMVLKKLNLDRASIGREGTAISRPKAFFHRGGKPGGKAKPDAAGTAAE